MIGGATSIETQECACSKTHLTRRVISGGSVQFWMQCLRCGRATSQPLSKAKATELASRMGFASVDQVAPWDQALRDEYERKLSETWKKAYESRIEQWDAGRWERSEAYRDYLLTPEWKAKRNLVLRRANGRCEGCGIADAEEVHHMKYPKRWGDEFLFDLVALCVPCHRRIHAP